MDPLRERINAAKNLIRAAERELDAALRAMQVRPRAEKTTVSQTVEGALGRLRAAKDSLIALEPSDDSPGEAEAPDDEAEAPDDEAEAPDDEADEAETPKGPDKTGEAEAIEGPKG